MLIIEVTKKIKLSVFITIYFKILLAKKANP